MAARGRQAWLTLNLFMRTCLRCARKYIISWENHWCTKRFVLRHQYKTGLSIGWSMIHWERQILQTAETTNHRPPSRTDCLLTHRADRCLVSLPQVCRLLGGDSLRRGVSAHSTYISSYWRDTKTEWKIANRWNSEYAVFTFSKLTYPRSTTWRFATSH